MSIDLSGLAADNIRAIINTVSSFKIGKTGLELTERLKDYNGAYEHIKEVVKAENKGIVDIQEAKLIEMFYNHPKCNNERGGSSGEMKESDSYRVYIVYS